MQIDKMYKNPTEISVELRVVLANENWYYYSIPLLSLSLIHI